MTDPIRVFIGTELKTTVPCQVLKHSIVSRTEHPVEFTDMDGAGWEIPRGLHQGTGFSLRRWMIPEKCGFEGRAIYCDADQIVLADINELWNICEYFPGPSEVWATYQEDKHNRPPKPPAMQSSVMLIDCAKASYWKTDWLWEMLRNKKRSYQSVMHFEWCKHKAQKIPVGWNHFNRHEPGETKLLHFTVERKQPWYSPGHKNTPFWEAELVEAIRAGYVTREQFQFALDRFGQPERGDRRRTFGLHKHFRKFLPEFDNVEAAK